jgi:hypothetical protein
MLEKISLHRMLNSEHLSLVQKIAGTIKKHIEALPELRMLSGKLETLAATEAKTLEALDKSLFTEQKTNADTRRDNAARQLQHYVASFEYSNNPTSAYAAHLLYELLKEIPAITSEGHERQTVDMANLVARLGEGNYAAAIENLKATELVKQLGDLNTEYNTISNQQTVTDSAKISGNVNAARKPVDSELRKIFRAIESRFDLETATDAVRTCLAELNYDISEAETSMKQRLAHTKGKTAGSKPAAGEE